MNIDLLVNLRLCREEFRYPQIINSDDIFLLVKTGTFVFQEFHGELYTVQAGSGALFRRSVQYYRKIQSPVTMYLFRYRSEQPAFPRDHVVFRDQARVFSTIAMLEQLDSSIYHNEHALRTSLFQDLITQYYIENQCLMPDPLQHDLLIEQSVDYIKSHFHRKISLTEVCARTALSYPQFIRRFRTHTGMPPQDFIIALRLQKAKTLLQNTELPIGEIAVHCGFENGYYFSNYFKKQTGMSPSRFRSTIL